MLLEKEPFKTVLANEWNAYGEEIILVATSCCSQLYDTHYAASIPIIAVILQNFAQCISLWNPLDSYVYTNCMNLIDMIGAQHNDQIQNIIEFYSQPERLNNIDNLEKLALILLVIVKHIKKITAFPSLT